MSIGFTTYNDLSIITPPTLAELLAAMTGPEKIAVLDAFVDKLTPNQAKYDTGVPKTTIIHLYAVMEDIELTCRSYMREEVITDIGPPVVYNTAPTTLVALKAIIGPIMVAKYSGAFDTAGVETVINKIILAAKVDASGDYIGVWSDYETGVQA